MSDRRRPDEGLPIVEGEPITPGEPDLFEMFERWLSNASRFGGAMIFGTIYALAGLTPALFAIPSVIWGDTPWYVVPLVPCLCFPLGFITAAIVWDLRKLPARFGRIGSAVLGAWAIGILCLIGGLLSGPELRKWPDILWMPGLGAVIGAIAAQYWHKKFVKIWP